MADHILCRRARFWLVVHDLAGVLRVPWRFRVWALNRAASTVKYDPIPPDASREGDPW